MRVLVTGCAGFIGFHLTDHLLTAGHEVVGMDNFWSGLRENIAALEPRSGFTFIEHNITQPLPDAGWFDRIYNLACPASPVDFERYRVGILRVCSEGVWRLAALAGRQGARLLHASTSEVYGDPQEHPQRETYWGHVNPIGPRSCYDEGKRFAEAYLAACRDADGLDVRVVRIFNTYGPRMRKDDGRALPTFIDQALRNEPVTIHGDGSQTRSFCYVTDLVDGILRLTESDVTEPVNIGNPHEISILQAAQEVIALTGSRSTIRQLPRPADDPSIRRPDITRARTLLNWEPRVDRREGFEKTIQWFRERR